MPERTPFIALAAANDLGLSRYRTLPGRRDEAIDEFGNLRPAWRNFLHRLTTLRSARRQEIASGIRQNLLETGIAFDVHADPEDRSAAWHQDLLPLVIDAQEWAGLEQGLIQRSLVIEALLRDVYGPQEFIRRGLVPAGLIFGNPAFLHPACNWPVPPAYRLTAYACDLVRQADGSWAVLADNTGAPSGHGWVLAGRIAMAAAYGDLFVGTGIERLADYFDCMQERITQWAGPTGKAVMLAQGPASANYFSHAYLARHLGIPLVEAGDLTQRHGDIHLKTLGGLERVTSIMRKVRSEDIDCLGVPGADVLGTPGLLQSAAAGRLSIGNATGTGVLDNRVMACIDPTVFTEITGQPPRIAETPALWLGDFAQAERYMAEADWSVSPITRSRNIADTRGRDPLEMLQDRDARAAFLAREGYGFVAERPTELPTTPAWTGDRLQRAHWALRCFVTLDSAGNYVVLPGGLVHQTARSRSTGMPKPEAIKDLWVRLPQGERTAPSHLGARFADIHLRRTGRNLLSRNAECLFWLGRYAERAELGMRVARTIINRLSDQESEASTSADLARIARILAEPCGLKVPANHEGIAHTLVRVLFERGLDYGMQQSLDGLYCNVAMARGEISQDGARVLQWLANDSRWRPGRGDRSLDNAPVMLSLGIQRLLAFAGSETENMVRDYALLFQQMGRRLERAMQMTRVIKSLTDARGDSENAYLLAALLEIADSSMTYRSRYFAAPLAAPVIDLLVLDETNPRALAFQVNALQRAMAELPHDAPYRSHEHRIVTALATDLLMTDADILVRPDRSPKAMSLHELLTITDQRLAMAADSLGIRHFAKAEVPQTTFAMRRALL